MSGGEFDFIERFFRPLAGEGARGLRDDAAVLALAEGRELVLSTDTLVEAVHFLPGDPAETVSQKLLRVSLSDCAAMGAVPRGYLLNVSRPSGFDDQWFASFSMGLAQDQAQYGVTLLGGDTTGTRGPLVLSLTILGEVEKGAAIGRIGARCGDAVWVTGTIGDAALGLQALLDNLPDPDGFLAGRYRLPRPRVGFPLARFASAAMDISDGLVQDAGHIASENGLCLEIEAQAVPRSPQALAAGERWQSLCLTGGDDYELLFTASPDCEVRIMEAAAETGIPVTRIGTVREGRGVVVRDPSGKAMTLDRKGWQHF
ncbi:thiamine-phosphate kinase [Swaminathania salitolerans]|uniref:Thiamine-monophosphate kinase n=1 Tax=Swaminathania salitolerans TaxID=182838 RepID=A0A511BNV9_9PROT|nr:thiamine-phosphate kinase [Swaminathania salitolerans]GBQ15207.1 thiamine monophosphate kinase [Swaminathania salitolerans LMG 21291]GEL02027.1 thiamine-monophosphate kinase [Swaminathania salitolerans]